MLTQACKLNEVRHEMLKRTCELKQVRHEMLKQVQHDKTRPLPPLVILNLYSGSFAFLLPSPLERGRG